MAEVIKTTERQLQRSTAQLVSWALRPGVIAFHVPNERERALSRKILSGLGVLPGVADWIILAPTPEWNVEELGAPCYQRCSHRSHAYAIELKTERGKQSKAQRHFQGMCEEAGVPYAVCRSLSEFADALRTWGLLRDGVEVE